MEFGESQSFKKEFVDPSAAPVRRFHHSGDVPGRETRHPFIGKKAQMTDNGANLA